MPAAEPEYARVVAFVGQPVDARVLPGAPRGPVTGLPAGLTLGTTGSLSGTPTAIGVQAVRVPYSAGKEIVLSIEVIAAPTSADRFVATNGNDSADGTREHPFATIQRALADVAHGGTVFLGDGVYREDVVLRDLHGGEAPITIRSLPGAHAAIAGAQAAVTWERSSETGAGPDEWVSREAFTREGREAVNRGAMAVGGHFVRLLTYSRVEDLRAANERWAVNSPTLPGPTMANGKRVAWTYFGPGVWHSPDSGRIYLRLSPTNNNVPGIIDYRGPREPAGLQIELWSRDSTPLAIEASSNVHIADVVVRGGGDRTLHIGNSSDVVLSHVEVDAATMGLAIGDSHDVLVEHSRIDGGIPTWSFRSDFKANYSFTSQDGTKSENNLVRKTSRALVYVGGGCDGIEIAYSELVDAHDIYFAGKHSQLHHSLISNIHDEALFISHVPDVDDLSIHHNVIRRVLSAISGVGGKPSGPRYVYGNIFDLRDPTQGYRPGASPRDLIWRWGHMFKGTLGRGPFYFYQNTVLTKPDRGGQPVLLHNFGMKGSETNARWFLNNIVDVLGSAPFSFVPDEAIRQAKDESGRPLFFSDGNAWVRPGNGGLPAFRCIPAKGTKCVVKNWESTDGLRETGFEVKSRIAAEPGFRKLRDPAAIGGGEDLRPGDRSPGRDLAIPLPEFLPGHSEFGADAGALPRAAGALKIGIDGRLLF